MPSGSRRQINVCRKVRLKNPSTGDFFGTSETAEHPGSTLPADVLHGEDVVDFLKEFGRSGEIYTVVKGAEIYVDFSEEPYPFQMKGEEVLEALDDIYSQGRCIWDLN